MGVNQSQVGCLIFPRDASKTDKVKSALQALITEANRQSPSHAQLGREMCFILTAEERIKALPKSSKGTIQRGLAYEEFKSEIYRLYSTTANGHEVAESKKQLEGEELRQWLMDRVREISGRSEQLEGQDELQEGSDLFSWGIDSVKAARLRFVMAQVRGISSSVKLSLIIQGPQNLDLGGTSLPLNVVFEYGTISR